MTRPGNSLSAFEVDEAFPTLTTTLPSSAAGAAGAVTTETPTVDAALSDVLGWRPRSADAKGFLAALNASFSLATVQGHVEATHTPRGYAIQADLGAVTGGQASLWSRARAALDQLLPLLDGLTPLRVDPDQEDCAAFRSLVRDAAVQLVDELGQPGGPRVARVDSYLEMLVGQVPGQAFDPVSADQVGGQVGQLRRVFGLTDREVNSIEDEKILTSFWTISDLIAGINESWSRQRYLFIGGGDRDTAGFLGTDLVIISRAMAAADQQVSDLEAILNSVFITAGERQTFRLPHGGMTLQELLDWLHSFLGYDGRTVLAAGRDGIETSFSPVARTLRRLVRKNLDVPVEQDGVFLILPMDRSDPPPGLRAARTRVAVSDLDRLLRDIVVLSSRIHRKPNPLILDATGTVLADRPGTVVQIETDLANPRKRLDLVLRSGESAVRSDPPAERLSKAKLLAEFEITPLLQANSRYLRAVTSGYGTRYLFPVTLELVDSRSRQVLDTYDLYLELPPLRLKDDGPPPPPPAAGSPVDAPSPAEVPSAAEAPAEVSSAADAPSPAEVQQTVEILVPSEAEISLKMEPTESVKPPARSPATPRRQPPVRGSSLGRTKPSAEPRRRSSTTPTKTTNRPGRRDQS